MVWKIKYTKYSIKKLKKLSPDTRKKLVLYMETKVSLMREPRSTGKPLKGKLENFWRYRVGDYRIVCKIDDSTITIFIVDADHRSKIYKS